MTLPNQYFQDFPIEFKQINPEDFPNFEVDNKIALSLNKEGYIGSGLKDNIDLSETNTVILNAGVGSGKTTAIINLVKDFYEAEQEYLIFVASPFVSLVQQYYLDIQSKTGIPENEIYRYELIGESDIDYTTRKVQVITANTLLGNPGEDSFINSEAKREYLNNLVNHCKDNNIKAVFIYDEIHDAIHNFREKFIFNLWKWHEVVHKNFIISATFNEASKVVIEYLAELTASKIQILECERIRDPGKQSDLFLHFDDASSYDNSNGNLCKILNDIFEKGMEVDILCHSKKLAKEICTTRNSGAGELLYNKYEDNVNECTSILNANQRLERFPLRNRYDKDKCNVGTNFKTGVSIEKDNHAFIIILPPKSSRGDFKNFYGIFSGGINAIIQAIARKRRKGEIHIILPKPKELDFTSLPFEGEKKEKFTEFYKANHCIPSRRTSRNRIRRDAKKGAYVSINEQDSILWDFYSNKLKANVLPSINHLESISETRRSKVRLEFPEYKLFKLEDGENYLAQKVKFFGDDLSCFVTYSAFTNQFVNCNLVYISGKPVQWFKEGKISFILKKYFENYIGNGNDWYWSLRQNVSDTYLYLDFRNDLFNNHKLLLMSESGEVSEITPIDKRFEPYLMAFVQKRGYPINKEFLDQYEPRGYIKELPLSRGEYFRFCISHFLNVILSDTRADEMSELVEAYGSLNHFRGKIVQSVERVTIKGNEIQYISTKPREEFISGDDIERFNSMVETLIEKDHFIRNEIFDFKRAFSRSENRDNLSKQAVAFYNIIKEDFFELKDKKLSGGENVKQIIRTYPIPEASKVMDFISPAKVLIPEEGYTTYEVVDGILQPISN